MDTPLRRLLPLVLLVAFLVGVRWALRSHMLIDFDAVNYALGLESYDVRANQPHMPGYFLYIALGRILLALTGEANEALVLLSALLGTATLVPLWFCARLLFGEKAGSWALLLGVTSPLLWFQSSVASSRTSEGFFATLVAWLVLILRRKPDSPALWWLALALALASGVRLQSALFLGPLVLWGVWRTPRLRLVGASVLLALSCAAWAIPMLQAIGGVGEYLTLSKAQSDTFIVHDTGVPFATSPGDAIRRLAWNLGRVLLYALFTLPALPLLLPSLRRLLTREQAVFFLLATAPSLAFFVVLHIQQPGHAMAYAPFLVLLAAGALARLPCLPGVAVATVNLLCVLFLPARLTSDWFNLPTLAAVRSNDVYLTRLQRSIKAESPPETTLLVAVDSVARPLDYYLPRYPALMLVIDDDMERPELKAEAGRGRPWQLQMPGVLDAPPASRTFQIFGRDARIEVEAATGELVITPRRYRQPWRIRLARGAVLTHDPQRLTTRVTTSFPVRMTLSGRTLHLHRAPR